MRVLLLITQDSKNAMSTIKHVVEINTPGALEYLKVLVSLPLMILVEFLAFIFLFKKQIRVLIENIKSVEAGGVKILSNNDELAESLANKVYEEDATRVAELPDSPEKRSEETELRRDIAALEFQLKQALDSMYYGSPFTANDFGLNPPIATSRSENVPVRRIVVPQEVLATVEPIIRAHIAETGSAIEDIQGVPNMVFKDYDSLYKKCIEASPIFFKLFGEKGVKARIYSIGSQLEYDRNLQV